MTCLYGRYIHQFANDIVTGDSNASDGVNCEPKCVGIAVNLADVTAKLKQNPQSDRTHSV